ARHALDQRPGGRGQGLHPRLPPALGSAAQDTLPLAIELLVQVAHQASISGAGGGCCGADASFEDSPPVACRRCSSAPFSIPFSSATIPARADSAAILAPLSATRRPTSAIRRPPTDRI